MIRFRAHAIPTAGAKPYICVEGPSFVSFVQEDRQSAQALIKLANTPREDYKPPEPGKQ